MAKHLNLVWDNGRMVPPSRTARSHSRHYVPSGQDAYMQTYGHVNCQHLFKHTHETYEDVQFAQAALELTNMIDWDTLLESEDF